MIKVSFGIFCSAFPRLVYHRESQGGQSVIAWLLVLFSRFIFSSRPRSSLRDSPFRSLSVVSLGGAFFFVFEFRLFRFSSFIIVVIAALVRRRVLYRYL